MPLFTPTNQKKLTNVAIVRLKKGGKRFEIACYPNKVNAWREKLEKDISEVLQMEQVFLNVSKGEVAKKEDLVAGFNDTDIKKICLEILDKGELQVTAKEREEQLESQYKDVATIIASRCINPDTKKPYSVATIEQAMKDAHIALRPNRTSKQMALDTMKKLKEGQSLKIQRAKMRLSIAVSRRAVLEQVKKLPNVKCESEKYDEETKITHCIVVCDPGDFRAVNELVTKQVGSYGGPDQPVAKVEVLELKADDGADSDEESESGGRSRQTSEGSDHKSAGKKASGSHGRNKGSASESHTDEHASGEDEAAAGSEDGGKGGKKANRQARRDRRAAAAEAEVGEDD